MARHKPKSPIEGRWNIVSMTEWDQEYLHKEVPAFIEFSSEETGQFHFGYVRGQMDCRATERDGKPAVEFTWQGFDEMEPMAGHGWAIPDGHCLTGVLALDDDDVSRFTARRPEQKQT